MEKIKEKVIKELESKGIVSVVMGCCYDEDDNEYIHTKITEAIWCEAIEQNAEVVLSETPDVVSQVIVQDGTLMVELEISGEVEYRPFHFECMSKYF